MANFAFLFLGVLVVQASGVIPAWQGRLIGLLAFILLLLPAGILFAIRQKKKLLTWFVERANKRWSSLGRVHDQVSQSEDQIDRLVCARPATLAGMMLISGLVWCLVVVEFWLCLRFLGIVTGVGETVSFLTASRLSYLLPLPAGLGALEASQFLASQLLGWGPFIGIAMSLVIRARDVLLAVVGLGVTGFVYQGGPGRCSRR